VTTADAIPTRGRRHSRIQYAAQPGPSPGGGGRGFGHAASGFLWYAVAAFTVGFALPERARAARDLTPTG